MQRSRLIFAAGLISLTIAACSGEAGPIFTSPTAVSTTSVTTTVDATTTSLDTTTTTTPASTTTAATTTTTSPPDPLIFLPTGIGLADFGDEPESVIAVVTVAFGPPTLDTNWLPGGGGPYGVCPGSVYRRVEFFAGDLVLQFTDAGYFAAEGERQFFAYNWYGGIPGPTPGPPLSLDAGATVQDIIDMYPDADILPDDPLFGPVFRVWSGGWEQLWGRVTGVDPSDTIINITGGVGCGE